ncbi:MULTISPECIES: WhiB family transcriptional regulator [Mycobacterium]|uniref:Transcriptional regulator WhiB n=1 Tax=Mycobacterium kiyosense TaxID=2871094 RepID=A0A9P3QDQ9_9MYCO|nr:MULTISPECIES: WhiB family transcriptional regulator [Mycobacterium]BDB40724.1 transcriptional regulator WhiB [Mycobacterium kiyosense]BDE12528.1 transcriptional regulator WhiB [Mycobacterium sp. 20KCMC460]GLB85854.1 transcriptional regulator WhiB [Mycobacterium kiyosense]GLB91016.1 transcriptional regulator WhiB [Mycobacterium kiyosense]GLB96984.1 transcriptional regulator WhiB [Mycobacterium kiyosense]
MSGSRPAARPLNLVAVSSAQDAGERAWVSKALCRNTDPDELFVTGAAQRKAANFCRHCPVLRQCGADALDNKVEFGIWGGMTERQRRALLKENPDVVSWSTFLDKRRKRSAG